MGSSTPRALAREQRRRRIEHAALELFRAKGFDHVTVEEVCAAADAAPATFYRHFGSKEEVVFAYRDDFTAAMRHALDAAADLPEGARLPVVLERFAGFLETQQDVLALRDEIVLGHPRLMQRTLAVQRDLETVLAVGLAHQRGLSVADPVALLEAGAGLLVLRVAVRRWRSGGGGSLLATTRLTLVELNDLTSGYAGS